MGDENKAGVGNALLLGDLIAALEQLALGFEGYWELQSEPQKVLLAPLLDQAQQALDTARTLAAGT